MPTEQHPKADVNATAAPGALRTVGTDLERYDGAVWKKVNAFDAVRLAASRSVSFTGDMTGSGTTDWSANLSIATTIGADTHAHRRPMFVLGGGGMAIGSGGWSGMNVTWVGHDPHGCQSGQAIVARVPGWWYVGYDVWWADQVTGQAIAEMWNWDPNHAYRSGGASDGAGRWARCAGGLQYSDGGRSAQVVVWQNSGANRTINEWHQFGFWVCP